MRFNDTDMALLAYWRTRLIDRYSYGKGKAPEAMWNQTELLWSGQHYMLIRQGPYLRERETHLLNREALLLKRGNKYKDNAMVTLAMSLIHPVNRLFSLEKSLMHVSNLQNKKGHEDYRGKRWSKKLLRSLIAYAEEKDEAFPAEEEEWIKTFDKNAAFSQGVVGYVADRVGEGKISGTLVADDIPYPVAHDYQIKVGSTTDGFSFRPTRHRTVQCRVRRMSFSESEFQLLTDTLLRINADRRQARRIVQLEQELAVEREKGESS